MADTTFKTVLPPLKAIDNNDGTFSVASGIQVMPANVTVIGTIDANGEIVAIVLPNGCGTVALQVLNIPGASQLNFEGTIDGITWSPVDASNGLATINATAGDDIFILPGAGYYSIRVRATLWGVGVCTITFIATIGTSASILTGALPAGANVIGSVATTVTKTIQTELMPITAVAADVQSVSSILALTGIKKATIFIDHAKDHASASVGQGTEYVVQVSEKATGNDTWRSLASFSATITAPTVITTDAIENAGQTLIEIGATTPVVGDILFWKNATIGLSEWSTVIAIATGVSCTLQDALTNTQAQGTYNTQGEHFVLTVDVESVTRLRVVCNNTKGTTNRAICWRCACITSA
jgi:hypothetical protein